MQHVKFLLSGCGLLLLLTALSIPLPVSGQTSSGATLAGSVLDSRTSEPLISATVGLTGPRRDTLYTASDLRGAFRFRLLEPGEYTVWVSYVGYRTSTERVLVSAGGEADVAIRMWPDVEAVDAVEISARATRAIQRGDSLIYNAESFKVLQGSTAEELLVKMPGIVVEGGTVEAQGEQVQKVLVDGREFFDGDVNLALKNLPADVIASIEVFDKKSEQAEFTGFDDGEQIKTINIVTKAGFRTGTFGEVSAGYGTDDRYRANGNVNIFDDERRISILGLSNNINQLNFSQEDLAGVISSGASGRGRGGRRGGGRSDGGGGRSGASGGSAAGNFMVGDMDGITASNGIGLNYVDQWGEKLSFSGSYFFNQSDNDTQTDIDRRYFESLFPGQTYGETSQSEMENWNHRLRGKLDYRIDSDNSLQFVPSASFQTNTLTDWLQGANLLDGSPTDAVENTSRSRTEAYNIGADLIYRHRFATPGRTLSAVFSGKISDKTSDIYSDYLTQTFGTETAEERYGQFKDYGNRQYTLRGNLMYTERLAEPLQLQAAYKIAWSDADADRLLFDRSTVGDLYDQLNEELSNRYTSDYLTHAAALGLRYHRGELNLMLGADFQYATLTGDQRFPTEGSLSKSFFSVLPSLTARYSLDRSNSLMLRYRSSSEAPEVDELQEVVDNSNPLFLSSGNADLDQQIAHTLNLRYIRTTLTGQTFIAMLGATARTDYIADSTMVADRDLILPSGITLEKGAQYTRPVNLNGYYSLQSMLTYGFPVDWIRSNINISFAANYANVPTLLNGVRSSTRELNLIPKVIIGSNISHNLDFTLSYSATINRLFNSQPGAAQSDYTNHLAAVKLGWTFWQGLTLRSTLNYVHYAGLADEAEDYVMWNASLGWKFLRSRQAEIRIEACDLLDSNRAFSHQISSSYYDYIHSNVLRPYVMLSLTYTFR